MEIIYKYNNRKLYSKTLRQYVNLEYILDNVRAGLSFKVLAYEKGVGYSSLEDVTASVLAQTIPTLGLTRETLTGLIKEQL